MKAPTFLSTVALISSFLHVVARETNITEAIIQNATADNINLEVLGIFPVAVEEIAAAYASAPTAEDRSLELNRRQSPDPNNVVDVHAHVVPLWYRQLVPTTGGNPTPQWDLDGHLSFMASEGIAHSIIEFGSPGANVFKGQKVPTVALARLLNEQSAAYCRAHPSKLSFFAVVPLPYTAEAIREADYAINTLGAVGIVLQSNFEGLYLGNPSFTPFFQAINGFEGRQILHLHPGDPYIKVGGAFILANPTIYPTGNLEYYFETARTLMDLTLTQTIHNFTNIHFVIPHAGGAFPSALDRILKSVPAIYDSSLQIYKTRFWWDSAGPTYFHQISGLLGIEIPKSQLLFGTDFPYAPSFVQPGALAAIKTSPLFTPAEKMAIFHDNAQSLFGSKVTF